MNDATAEQQPVAAGEAEAAAPPPLPQRRPRVREVSSRFMSPLVSSNPTATPTPTPSDSHHRSKSAQRRRHHHDEEPENVKPPPPPQTALRSSFDDTPWHKGNVMSSRKQNQQSQRAKQQLFRENVGGVHKAAEERQQQHQQQQQQHVFEVSRSKSRPDTPTVMGTDRVVPSRFRQMSQHSHRSSGAITPAAKLLQEATSSSTSRDDTAVVQRKLPKIVTSGEAESNQPQPRSCPNSPICVYSNKSPAVVDTRASMPESSFSNNCESSSKLSCSRSLDLLASKMGALLPLPPPHPMSSKLGGGADARRGKKLPSHQEDLHSLKLLHNHYLQWRYANAKAEASMKAQKKEAEGKLYALGSKISDLREVVKRKRIELATLQRVTTLSTILEGHMGHLDEWSGVEEDYSTSLKGMICALLNTSLRLPVSGEVRVDVEELGDALNSAKKVMEMIALHIQSFMPKAEELDALSSELARVTGRERGLIEECGDLIFKTHASQINEWSLRGHLMQLDSGKHCQSQQECENMTIP